MVTEQPNSRWFIDRDWYQQNSRSFFTLVQGCLCPKCQKKLKKAGTGELSVDDVLSAIGMCCSKAPGFITGQLPFMESVFRLFLANDNQPLGLEEIGAQLNRWRGVDTYRTSAEVLPRLLESDRYYGLRQVKD